MKTISAAAFLTVGLLVGIGGTTLTTRPMEALPVNRPVAGGAMHGMPLSASPVSSMSMAHMTASLKNTAGDDFDRRFLSEMTAHHQGALDMARLAATQAKHQEVKDLANGIIVSQASQIAQMKRWQKDWGYSR